MKDIAIGIAKKCKSEGVDSIAVARDGRLSGESLLSSFCEAMISYGLDVNCIGLATSPMLYFAAKKEKSKVVILSSSADCKYLAPLLSVQLNASYSSNVVDLPKSSNPLIVKRTCFTNKAFNFSELNSEDKNDLEIPAFLRRQTN